MTILLLSLFMGCGKSAEAKVSLPVSYEAEGGSVLIEEVSRGTAGENVSEGMYVGADFFDVFTKSAIVVKGTVTSVRDISLKQTFADTGREITQYRILIDVKITEVFKADEGGTEGDTVTFIYMPWDTVFKEGETCIIFGTSLKKNETEVSVGLYENGVADYGAFCTHELYISYDSCSQENLAEVFRALSSEKNASAVDAGFVAEGKTYTLGDVEAYLRVKCGERR